jgi:Spy/CpxP family protein refolding chaperone
MRKTLFVVGTVVIAATSLVVLAAQHVRPGASSGSPANPFFHFLHETCADLNVTDVEAVKAHVPEHFATMLELTSAQVSELDRLSTDACRTLARAHVSIMHVLTAEQRAKVHELHKNGHGDSAIHELMKKLHGK